MVDTKAQIAETQQLLAICREYIVGLSMEIVRKEMPKVSPERKSLHFFSFCSFVVGDVRRTETTL